MYGVRKTIAFAGLVVVLQAPVSQGQPGDPRQDTYAVIGVDKTLIRLPSVEGVSGSKIKALGIGGSTALVEIPGASAMVRLRAADAQIFVLARERGTVPDTLRLAAMMPIVQLHKLDIKKGNREWVISNTTSYGVIAKSKSDFPGIPLNLSGYDSAPDSILIEPRSRLAPGEYAFVTLYVDAYQGSSYRFHCFGIDR